MYTHTHQLRRWTAPGGRSAMAAAYYPHTHILRRWTAPGGRSGMVAVYVYTHSPAKTMDSARWSVSHGRRILSTHSPPKTMDSARWSVRHGRRICIHTLTN